MTKHTHNEIDPSRYELSNAERETRRLLEQSMDRDWNPARGAIRKVFRMMWAHSIPARDVIKIAEAAGYCGPVLSSGKTPIERELTRMVREGTLRSRQINVKGQRITLYEVNYA